MATVWLDPSDPSEPFQGWGTALAWFAHATGGWPEPIRSELADALFGHDGLGFTIARYNIGGGDSPETEPYLRAGADVPGWWRRPAGIGPVPEPPWPRTRAPHHGLAEPSAAGRPGPDQRDWWDPDDQGHWAVDPDPNQRWWLRAARDRGADVFEAFSNSPPYFMTASGYVSGHEDPGHDNLRPDQYRSFARYLAGVARRLIEVDGIPLRTLSPVNEPNTAYWHALNRQEGCHWNPRAQSKIIIELAEELRAAGLDDVIIAGPDETDPAHFIADWEGWTDEARAAVGQLNVHSYGVARRPEVCEIAVQAGKPLWMSEVDLGPGGLPLDFDDIRPGLALARQIIGDLTELRPRAWVFWQAIEDHRNMIIENQNWGLIQVDFAAADPAREPIRRNLKYWVMAQFSRFIRPGAQLITTRTDSGGMDTVAALGPEPDRLVVVHVNGHADPALLRLDLSGFPRLPSGGAAIRCWSTAPGRHLAEHAPLPVTGSVAELPVDAWSVTTLELDGLAEFPLNRR
ncbi:glycoside hydrolase [Microlunatus sp. GCM10028923]|uniref:glycoside hydrolase family 30 protein n=1 Tax=Microlunatus sp. GCM10028923 TaxID=3273400 RepID=UPI0036224997